MNEYQGFYESRFVRFYILNRNLFSLKDGGKFNYTTTGEKIMNEDVKVEQGSGNVFKDLGFSDAEAERALLKADLAFEIYNIIEAQKLTQAKAGKILGVDLSDISRLKGGDFNRFSVERLFTLLNHFNRNIEIRITPAEDRQGHQRVVVV